MRRGLSQRALASRAGTTQAAVAAYEAGRRQPTVPTLYRLLAAAGFEPRIRLAALDDHDRTVAEWEASRPADERASWDDQQERFVDGRR